MNSRAGTLIGSFPVRRIYCVGRNYEEHAKEMGFTGLITTQRAYSASSKIITTADEMLAELINIKR